MMLAISRSKDPKVSAPYLSLLKLSHSPFSDHAGEAFFYADPERAQYLDMLQHLAQYSDEVLLVSGEAGSGKTELLERFLARAEEHWRTCRLDGGQRLEADKLFARIAECFALNLSGGNLLEAMQGQLSALQEQQLPVLLIDDAQALSDDALEIVIHLAALEGEHGKLIRVLMFADPGMDSRLANERFAAMPQPHRQVLHGLDEEQAQAYLEHRLHAAGYQGEPLFSERDIKQLLRQSDGLPGRLNEAAHALLRLRLEQSRPRLNMKRYLQMGVAASAVIGTVLGLNDKINALLGGAEPSQMSVSAPERPVVRLAEEGNPWAVVIRDGESIQINCGAPGGTTVGVRPLMTAAAEIDSSAALSQPILRDVTPKEAASPAHAAEPGEAAHEAPAPVPEEASAPQHEAATARPMHDEPGAAESSAPITVASNAVHETPLVVKPQEPQPEHATEQQAEKAKGPVEVKLEGVEPSPVPAGDAPVKVTLKGSGFQPGSKVAVSHAGNVRVLPQHQVVVTDSNQIAISITPGKQPSDWAVQVSTPDNHRSNVLRFRVDTVAKAEHAEAKPVTQTATEKQPVKVVEKAAEPAQPKPPEKTPPAAKKKTAASSRTTAPARRGAASGAQGYEWYAGQPKSNYTLQLFASEKRTNTEAYARQHQLKSPVAEFAMEQNGKRLYAVTQGSYPSRAAAEKAASALPAGMKPWVRSIESIQRVMKPEQAVKKAPAAPALSGDRYKDTAWVWSQDPNHYTVQLSAASSEQAIEADMRRIALPGEMTVVQTLRDGKPWYALVYGSFASKEAARGTIERLPASLKQSGPWSRSFASLQDELSQSTPPQ